MEEGPYALEIQVVIKAMPSQLRFTKNEESVEEKKQCINFDTERTKKGEGCRVGSQ